MSAFDPDKSEQRLPDDEPGIARVLRAAGSRAQPADDMKEAVRAAVHAEWRATVAKRSQRRTWYAIAASVTIAALALWVGRTYFMSSGPLVASVSRSIGTVQLRDGIISGWHAATSGAHVGEELQT